MTGGANGVIVALDGAVQREYNDQKGNFCMKRTLLYSVVLFAVACLMLQPVQAQVLYGSIVGIVEDPSGGAIPGADIHITNEATGQSHDTKTDGEGRYLVGNVLPGLYEVKITASGFRGQTSKDVTVTANTVSRVDLKMEVGSVTETVAVEANATLLQTDKSDTHSVITSKELSNLALPAYRNYQSLINLVPGATPGVFQNSATDTPNRALRTNINGTNANNNMTRIDGAASVNLWLPHHAGYIVPEEMVQEVNITTSAADAEQGMAGGSAVTVVTKSGTNDLHGSAFEFHDDQHLKARNFFQAPGVDKPLSIYNNYGVTLGGPVVKNKLFYFGSWDATRQRQGAIGRYSVPTADIRTGDFSAYSTIIYDPNTGNPDGTGRQPFAANRIPANRISPITQKIEGFFPAPNLPGAANNYFASGVPKFDRDYIDIKMNYNRNERHSIWGKYGHMSALVAGQPIFGVAGGPAPGADPGTGDTHINNGSIGHTYTFSPTVLMDGVFGYQRMEQSVLGSDFGKNYGQELGIPGLNGPDIRQSGFPNIDFPNDPYNNMGVPGWMPLFRIEESFTTSHNVTWNRGAHEFRFGFDGVLHRMNHWQPELGAGPRGDIAFSSGPTSLGPSGNGDQYNTYAAFLLGLPSEMQKSIQYILMTPREWQFGWYARDRWQVSRKLTVNLGLRYEFYPLMTRAGGKGIERLDPNTNQVFLGGRGNIPTDVGVTVSHRMFAPRLGVAYRLDENTVIRTGYGLNWDPLPFSRPLRGFYPLTVNFDFKQPNGYAPVRPIDQGIPPVFGPDLSTGVVDLPAAADMRSPYKGLIHRGYIQSWNFTIERRLPMQLVASAGYVGTQTTHQLADLDINTGFPGSGNAGRPYASRFGRTIATNMWDGYLSSHYHSLQTSLNKQFSKGLLVKGAYTYSKAINMADDDGWQGVNWNWAPVFYRNRAPAGYDRTHVFQIGWVYELPIGKGKAWVNSGPASYILGNWQVNGVMSAYTGTPFNITAPGSSLNAPGNMQTPNQVKTDVVRIGAVGPGTNYYDPTAFAAPTVPLKFGTVGRNRLRNPGVWNTNLSIFRNFPIRERATLSFRAEFYNFPNTSHFGSADNGSGFASGNVTSSNFLRITSAYGERQVRFGMRLGF